MLEIIKLISKESPIHKNQHDGSTTIKRWAKEFMDEINVQFVKVPIERRSYVFQNQRKKHYGIMRYGYF
jgi:hypothetical protein